MIQKFFKGDFQLAETFKDSEGHDIAVPSHVRINYFTRSKAGIITVERDGDTTSNCYVSQDGMTLIASLPLSRRTIGKGEVYKVVEVITEDANFPGDTKIAATPGRTWVVLIEGPSDNSDTVLSESIGVIMMYGYSAYQLAVQHGYEGTEEEWLNAMADKDYVDTAVSSKADKDLGAREGAVAFFDDRGNPKGSDIDLNNVMLKDGHSPRAHVGLADAAKNLASWAARDDSPIESDSFDLIRTTGGDESINSGGGAKLMAMKCVGADFTPSRIISSGFNLLRLQSNNGLAVAVGTGYYFPVPKLTATNDSIGTANENNGVLFTDSEGNNLTPTVYFKPLASGVPTSITDGTVATYLDKNGRRHYTTSGPGYLIVSGITWASTCAHLGWSTNYDKYVSPTANDDAGTIVSTIGVGTLRSVGSGGAIVSDRADRSSDSQMVKTVNVGVTSSLNWVDSEDVDSEGVPTGTYTHKAVVSAMLPDGVAEIKVSGVSAYNALSVDGQTVSFQDATATVASGYSVKYQLATPTTSTVNVSTVFANINDWGIEYVDATGEGNGLWQYVQGIPDAIYGLLGKMKEAEGNIDGLGVRVDSAEEELTILQEPDYHDIGQVRLCGQPMKLFGAGTPQEAIVPDNWHQLADGGYDWNGIPSAIGQEYINTAVTSGGHYIAVRDTNMGLKWYNC